MNVNQGKLALCFKYPKSLEKGEYEKFIVTNSILGGGTHSKLFIEVREKNSLAYYCYSFLEKYKGLLFIAAGIEGENYEKTKKIIFRQLEDIKDGNITEEQLASSKSKVISDLMKIKDSQFYFMNYLVSLDMYGDNKSIEDTINCIKEVKLQDIALAAKKFNLGSIYFLTRE